LWAFVDREQSFLHDRLAGTRIVSGGAARSQDSAVVGAVPNAAPDTTSCRPRVRKT
jgi:hypothetical protein